MIQQIHIGQDIHIRLYPCCHIHVESKLEKKKRKEQRTKKEEEDEDEEKLCCQSFQRTTLTERTNNKPYPRCTLLTLKASTVEEITIK